MDRSRSVVAAVALASVALLGSCRSQPSAKAVAKDVVQSITVPGGEHLPQAQQDCMLGVIDKMSTDQVKKLGSDNLNATITKDGGGDAAMQSFIDDLQRCQTSSATPTTTAGSATATTSAASTTTTTLG